jgi:hypothetical protein
LILPTYLRSWMLVPICLVFTLNIGAQCSSPTSFGLTPPQTSTALVLKWTPVSQASQYQIRFWETASPSDKTIVEDCGLPPFTLRGLRKNTAYTLEIRSKCGNEVSVWSPTLTASTINSSASCAGPSGVEAVVVDTSDIRVTWTSSGIYSIRYRKGNSGDWLIPSGSLNLLNPPFIITDLAPGPYQVELKRHCSGTSSDAFRATVDIAGNCETPAAPIVTPGIFDATLDLPAIPGVLGYYVSYREGTAGNWVTIGTDIPPSLYLLEAVLNPGTEYQVQVQAVCDHGLSELSPVTTFTTLPLGPCLPNKNFGKNLSPAQMALVDQQYNQPSPFSFGSMIGVNDGGLVFRSFQQETRNQITDLTTQFRNFHTMDEDFDSSLETYELNIKPKDTQPEGTPAHTDRNKSLYSTYRQQGFLSITGATEILQYAPQSWKEKIYRESDWSMSGTSGILQSYENYTKKFIDEFAPANGTANQILVSNYQVGNELWDYPVKSDYHSLLIGARNAFLAKYGPKSAGKWRMRLVAGAFQAYRDNNCPSILRDFSNCNGGLERHDFIGDYLEVADCGLLQDLDAIDCHPYSFKPGTNDWTHPEDPTSETWQIRNLAAWLKGNQNDALGILSKTRLWSSEYGFDSYAVGEKTQNAYLLRGLLLHSRYHYEKLFFYNAYDVARTTDQYYYGLYNSAGFWKLGTHPANSAWASPIEAHGASAKPAWFGMLDLKERFGEHVFHKALLEDEDAFVFLIAKPDSTDPYLVFWSPRMTNDMNIHLDVPVMKNINWQGALTEGYMAETANAQTFAESDQAGTSFEAFSGRTCGALTINMIRRSPAFVRLTACAQCPNVTDPGAISLPTPNMGGGPFDPGTIASTLEASGGSGGSIVYQWQQSLNNNQFTNIPGATEASYDPPSLTETTYFRRAAKRSSCPDLIYSPSVVIVVGSNNCPKVNIFKRVAHDMLGCNPDGDYFYEIALNQVGMNDQITIQGLPNSGIDIPLSTLNGTALTPSSFQSNLHYVNNNTLQWQVNASLGNSQMLRLFYCWADAYPSPVGATTATSLCSGQTFPCAAGFNAPDPGEDRSGGDTGAAGISIAPNPGTDWMLINYEGPAVPLATLRIVSSNGQCLPFHRFKDLYNQQQLAIDMSALPAGVYFVCLQTGAKVDWVVWEKI